MPVKTGRKIISSYNLIFFVELVMQLTIANTNAFTPSEDKCLAKMLAIFYKDGVLKDSEMSYKATRYKIAGNPAMTTSLKST